jgi:hypothetical protein
MVDAPPVSLRRTEALAAADAARDLRLRDEVLSMLFPEFAPRRRAHARARLRD